MSGSRWTIWTQRWSATATRWAWSLPIGNAWRIRASRRCCSPSGPRSSSCSEPSDPTPPSGVHHLAYRVEDVVAALARLREEGIEPIDEVPRLGSRDTLIAFVHPKDMEGVLVELVQVT